MVNLTSTIVEVLQNLNAVWRSYRRYSSQQTAPHVADNSDLRRYCPMIPCAWVCTSTVVHTNVKLRKKGQVLKVPR